MKATRSASDLDQARNDPVFATIEGMITRCVNEPAYRPVDDDYPVLIERDNVGPGRSGPPVASVGSALRGRPPDPRMFPRRLPARLTVCPELPDTGRRLLARRIASAPGSVSGSLSICVKTGTLYEYSHPPRCGIFRIQHRSTAHVITRMSHSGRRKPDPEHPAQPVISTLLLKNPADRCLSIQYRH